MTTTGRWSDPAKAPTLAPITLTGGVTSTWSSWLWGRCAGHVLAVRPRRQPAEVRADRRAPEIHVAGQRGGDRRRGQLGSAAGTGRASRG